MNKFSVRITALLLVIVLLFTISACKKNTKIDLTKFPMVYADDKGLEMLEDGADKPVLISEKFHTASTDNEKVQIATNGKIYYIQTEKSTDYIGDLYEYDINNKESELIHKGVYNYKVNIDGSAIIINDGTGSILKYDEKHEKKNDYSFIQKGRVSKLIAVSENGDYVLYTQMLQGSNTYTLTMAKTDFETSDEITKRNTKEILANKDIEKAPVVLSDNFKEFVGATADLSAVYFSTGTVEKGGKETRTLLAAKDYTKAVKLAEGTFETYFVKDDGTLLYSVSKTASNKVTDIVTDKSASADEKLKKKDDNDKEYKAKQNRDEIRKKIKDYIKNFTTTTIYKYDEKAEKPAKVVEYTGQAMLKGTDSELYTSFFGVTQYDFSKAKKPDINKVNIVYKLFDDIKVRKLTAVTVDGETVFSPEKAGEYNSGDCFVDTQNKKISVIMNVDYLKTKVGTLYTAKYGENGFEDIKTVSKAAAKVAHFNSADDVYFVNAKNELVKNDVKTVVLKDYGKPCIMGGVPIVYTSVDSGKKDKYGNKVNIETAYLISGGKAQKLGDVPDNKPIITKASAFAYFKSYDFAKNVGEAVIYNGSKTIELGKKVSVIYDFN